MEWKYVSQLQAWLASHSVWQTGATTTRSPPEAKSEVGSVDLSLFLCVYFSFFFFFASAGFA
jgi:hypothetical protein